MQLSLPPASPPPPSSSPSPPPLGSPRKAAVRIAEEYAAVHDAREAQARGLRLRAQPDAPEDAVRAAAAVRAAVRAVMTAGWLGERAPAIWLVERGEWAADVSGGERRRAWTTATVSSAMGAAAQ